MPAGLHLLELGPADVELMRDMSTMFGEAFREVDTYGGAPPGAGYLRRLLSGREFIALAATHDGTVVGGLVAYELRKFERERSEIYVYDLAVAKPYRRRGVATALVAELRRIATARGAWVIFIQADRDDDPAIALYSKLGRREEVLHFDIGVESDA